VNLVFIFAYTIVGIILTGIIVLVINLIIESRASKKVNGISLSDNQDTRSYGRFKDTNLTLFQLTNIGLMSMDKENINKEFTNIPFTFDEISDLMHIEYIEKF